MRRKPHLPGRRSQKQRKQRRSSATDLTLRSLQIIRYEVLYLKTRLIIISFPNILLWHLFLALSKLDFFSKMPFPTKVLRFPPWPPPLVDAILKLSIQTWKIQPELFKFRPEELAHARRWQFLFNMYIINILLWLVDWLILLLFTYCIYLINHLFRWIMYQNWPPVETWCIMSNCPGLMTYSFARYIILT